ncbi:ATP-binding protein [Flavobacterium sp. Root186]|uniref:ATP-binding protein n=1 Tax=Flavobacterium sp. Root186 TaxID=1736485 RepID=UPI000700DF5B|nr:ATP-binding protein [Flavobacterium sp. Root186]KRB59662.1 hypothetical protein ASD98_00635 [Flavobacterium sp. Root186]
MGDSEKLHFKTNVLLKSIIGKDLITDDNIAVLELVKNSFDALSKSVNIIFSNIFDENIENSKLVIQDFGKGMNEKDIQDKWLNIAYSEKKNSKNIGDRLLAGNKGVGRFSCDRLGEYLNLYTRTSNDETINHLYIDWTKFEIDDNLELNIQDIDLRLVKLSVDEFITYTGYDSFSSGTILEIKKLRREWDYNKILNLKNNLEKLINPNQAFSNDKFKIEIIANEIDDNNLPYHQKINGEVGNRVFDELNFKSTSIESTIDSEGKIITTKLFDRGVNVFTLTEENRYSLLKDIKITIFYLNPYAKAYFTRQTGIRSVHFGSIFLFINGFRIPPYGDDGDDWLNLELRKGQGYNRFIGARELLGRIEVIDHNSQFKIISSRAGIVNNDVFEELTKESAPYGFYFKTHRRLERYVVEGLKWDSAREKDENIEKKVLSESWDESKEEFKEDELVKIRRALNSIVPIIGLKKDEIKTLQINEKFIGNIIDKEIEKKSNEVDELIGNIAENYTIEDLEKITSNLKRKINEVEILQSDTKISESNEFGIEKFDYIQKKLTEALNQFSSLQLEKLEVERERQKLEAEKKKLEEELQFEIEKNTYLRYSSRGLSEDAKGLIHNIKITSKNIQSNVHTLIEKIRNKEIKDKELIRRLEVINFNSEKALKISKLITRSNFKTQANTQIVDVVRYIEQYISIYSDMYENSKLQFVFNNNSVEVFEKRLSILELSLIIDDLISNSEKAGAKIIQIDIQNGLEILFSDDGKGLSNVFLDRPEKIFELGITTTDGSGIGLNSVRNALNQMQAKISFVGNGIKLSGATFKIDFI